MTICSLIARYSNRRRNTKTLPTTLEIYPLEKKMEGKGKKRREEEQGRKRKKEERERISGMMEGGERKEPFNVIP